ncbi:hypothetical protein [Legionella sp. CNM-4043-24]|uniref:hypothetical protein n=1 Tax=Legionella sp. CNM-4043-24 TaxID=3421646 RepID=UPI00403AFDDF
MLGLVPLYKNNFWHQFLAFRIRYYCNETSELIARHKLLTVFILCLLAPGVRNIQAVGVPFYALIDPAAALNTKFFYLVGLLFSLLSLTRAQSSFIKGGVFRDYLQTVYIPARIHKRIDFIILVLSLNIIWIAIIFGGVTILSNTDDSVFRTSQYCLYASTIFALCTLLFNFLHKNTGRVFIVLLALLLVVDISRQGQCVVNFGLGAGVAVLCGLMFKTTEFHRPRYAFTFKIPRADAFNGLRGVFIIQLAVLRKYRLSLVIRFVICCSLSILVFNILNFQETTERPQAIVLVLSGLQIYILSTLFTLFERERLEHAVFHHIFPYQKQIQPLKEAVLIWTGFMLVSAPVLSGTFHLITALIIIALNRFIYTLSLRFCLFSSLLATAGACIAQYFFLGAWYGW